MTYRLYVKRRLSLHNIYRLFTFVEKAVEGAKAGAVGRELVGVECH